MKFAFYCQGSPGLCNQCKTLPDHGFKGIRFALFYFKWKIQSVAETRYIHLFRGNLNPVIIHPIFIH